VKKIEVLKLRLEPLVPESRHPSPVSGGRGPFRSLRSLKRAEL